MGSIISGLALIIIGSAVIVFKKPFVDISVGYQVWAFRMPFGKRTLQIGYRLVPIMGLLFVIAGILVLLGIVK